MDRRDDSPKAPVANMHGAKCAGWLALVALFIVAGTATTQTRAKDVLEAVNAHRADGYGTYRALIRRSYVGQDGSLDP